MREALRLYVLVGPPPGPAGIGVAEATGTATDPAEATGTATDPGEVAAGTDLEEAHGPEPDPTAVAAVVALARAAIEGGATMLQLRAKGRSTDELVGFARALVAVCRPAGVPLIINDRVDVARAAGAEGVHLGPEDGTVDEARAALGPDAVVGVSAGTPEEARAAERRGASYLGIGDVFGTVTKLDADEPIGVLGLSAVLRATALPAVAIGGVTEGNAAEAIAAGAAGVAVVSAVAGAADPRAAAARLRAVVDAALAAREAGAGSERNERIPMWRMPT